MDVLTGGGVTSAKGFRAGAVASGIKKNGALDLTLVASDEPATAAGVFTKNKVRAAPVTVSEQVVGRPVVRGVIVNSGNANTATGGQGLDNAAKMQGSAAIVSGVGDEALVAVAATGVIGVQLPMDAVTRGILAAAGSLSADGDAAFAEAIQTTDSFEKRASLSVELPGGTVRLSAQAKGAGMIQPGFATLLVFVQTDAALAPETCDLLLGVTVKRSFERISVDGQLSTSDTVILQCSGSSGVKVEPESEDELRFGEALDALLRQLALLVVRDGEGARRVGRVVVHGGEPETVDRVARAIANSSLVKTALYGGDPNWGRIAQAVGMATAGMAPLALDISIEGVQVCVRGGVVRYDADALKAAVQREEVEYEIGLPGAGAETELFYSDLGHEYVTINADYTT